MEFMQCWIGKKPKKILNDCINTVRSHITNNDKYTMISTTNFLNDTSVNWIPYEDYLNELTKDEKIKKFLSIIDKYNYKSINTTKSDIIRFKYASDNKDVLYVDTDVKLKSLPVFDINKSYFAPNKNRRTTIDSYIYYNGNNTKLPKIILNKALDNLLESTNKGSKPTSIRTKAWAFIIFNNIVIRKQVEKIDHIHFEHLENTRI